MAPWSPHATLSLQDLVGVRPVHPTGTIRGVGRLIAEGRSRDEGGYLLKVSVPWNITLLLPGKDLASRDVVSRPLTIKIREDGGVGTDRNHIYLQLSHLLVDVPLERLSGISETAAIFAGVDVAKEPISVLLTQYTTTVSGTESLIMPCGL
ncbi:hypothetical protein F5141DRAFT_212331 [Pisolithus sp. B1]|nr:hypothetical protein F5141DRAFT_212331 [Pisolithus sp. B1]